MRIGILGGKGMLGSNLVEFFRANYEVSPIDRDNYREYLGRGFDILVNANGNSRRFWANEHQFEDFEASAVSVYKSLFDFRFETYIYISSPDVYENPDNPEFTKENRNPAPRSLSPYGFHKYLAERIVERCAKEYLILRSASLLGKGLKKGVVYDILNGSPLFVAPESEMQFVTTNEIAKIIQALTDAGVKKEIFNVGGRGAVSVPRIAELAAKRFTARSGAEKQRYEMAVEKLGRLFPLRTSEEYLKEFLSGRAPQEIARKYENIFEANGYKSKERTK